MSEVERSESYTQQHEPEPVPPTSGVAIISMILSTLGLIGVLPILGSIVGLMLGYSARQEIEASQGAIGGQGLAQAAIILGWVSIGMAVLLLCLIMAGVAAIPGIALCAGLSDVMNCCY